MADENNLTTLAKRLRPLLGNFVQNLVKSVIDEGPGIDLTISGDITTVGMGGDTILLYHSDGSPISEYEFTLDGLNDALDVAMVGDVIFLPAGQIQGTTLGAEIATGAITVTSETGVLVSGLVIGDWYSIEAYNGPWIAHIPRPPYGEPTNVQGDNWSFYASLGTFFESAYQIGLGFDRFLISHDSIWCEDLPAWGAFIEAVDAYYGRLHFQAVTTSIRVRVGDQNTLFYDNGGTLSWRLRSSSPDTITIPYGVELVGLGTNSALIGNVINDGILTNLKVSGTITGDGICRLVANPNIELFTNQIKSTLPTGTSPLNVASTTLNTNLNADLLDGLHAAAFLTDLPNHDHSGDAGDGGTFDAANLTSGASDDGQVLTSDGSGGAAWEEATGGAGGHIIEDEGTPLTERANLNFVGEGVTVTDDAVNDRTIVTVPGYQHIVNEDHSATCNGVIVQFSTSDTFLAGSTVVTLNGITQRPGSGNSYVEDVGLGSITFATAPHTGDELLISYVKSGVGAGTSTPADIYIDDDGSDITGDGTSGNPYATIAKALSILPDHLYTSCTIHVADGTYAEEIDIRRFRCQAPILLKITGNTTTPANVSFTDVITVDGLDYGMYVSGNVNAEIEGAEINVTAFSGIRATTGARLAIDRCDVTGTLNWAISCIDYGAITLHGDINISGFDVNGIQGSENSKYVYKTVGTLTITGPTDAGTGIGIYNNSSFLVQCQLVINIYEVQHGIHAGLNSEFQHYAQGGGSITLDNVATPPSYSNGLESNDVSTVSTDRHLTIDHFGVGITAYCVAWVEASGGHTFTNVGNDTYYFSGGYGYLS